MPQLSVVSASFAAVYDQRNMCGRRAGVKEWMNEGKPCGDDELQAGHQERHRGVTRSVPPRVDQHRTITICFPDARAASTAHAWWLRIDSLVALLQTQSDLGVAFVKHIIQPQLAFQ